MTGQNQTLIETNPYLILNNRGQVIRFELQQQQHILGRDPSIADLALPLNWEVISRCQAILKRDGADYLIYDGDGQKPSSNKLYVNRSLITPQEGYRLTNGIEIHIAQNPNQLIQIRYFNPSSSQPITTPAQRSISLKHKSVLLGRDISANLQLEAPTVSRRHATIDTDSQGRYILQDHSSNGVFVNGQLVSGKTVLSDGSTIRIGSIYSGGTW